MTCSGLGRHLRSCPERRKSIERANGRSGSNELLHHLQVRDGYGLGYWLHLEMDGSATLFDLDHYLRHIWLECCGHMSAFKIEGVQYLDTLGDSFGFEESESLDAQAHQLFTPGLNFAYEYDFGTTTELSIRVLDQRGGKPSTTHGLALMARNAPRPGSLRAMRKARPTDLPRLLLRQRRARGGLRLPRPRRLSRHARRLRRHDGRIQLAPFGRLRV